jgi:hypothetical protein
MASLVKAARRKPLALENLEERAMPSATVSVDAGANVHAIDPNIYGIAFATTAQLANLNIPLNRDGGNASDTYSFSQDATNHASDWYFESIPYGTGNGQGIDSFVSTAQAGGAQPSITLNLFDWAAKLGNNRSDLGSFSVSKYGPQQAVDPYNSNWGNGVLSNGSNVTGNDPNDAYIANSPTIEQAWIQHLISTFGDSQHGGVQYYTLGNEPGLWNSTHRDIHPAGDTLPELLSRMTNYASMIRSLDPNAKILGPEEWGWTNYFISGADAAAQNWGATYNGLNAEQWLLQQLQQQNASTGQRLLDYFTLHFYPQGGEFGNDVSNNMELLRNRSTRSLWDPNYVDESWIGGTGINGGKVNLINMMKGWVNTYYPGTKLGITEYNWGAEGNMNGATTQADIWGIFGREGLNLADRWTTPATGSPTYLAMQMFRNYDGHNSIFGDQSVSASVANPDQVDAFSAIRSSDGALTIMVVNKNLYDPNNPTATTQVTLALSNFASTGDAQEWQLAAINPSDQTKAAITQLSDITFNGSSFTVNVPQESVEVFVLKPVQKPIGTLGFALTSYTVNESAATATISVGRTNGSSGAVTIQYATSDGSAHAPADYTATSGTLTFADGQTSQSFTVTIANDAVFEGKETVNLTLSQPGGGANLGSSTAVLTIADDDATPNQRFVGQVYLDLLQRPVDSSGLAAWTNMLNKGGSRQAMVSQLESSLEYRTDVVKGLYTYFLHRAADPTGLNAFVTSLGGTGTVEQIESIIVGSSEYFQNRGGGTNDGFLNALYQDALNRPVDPTGRKAWDAALAGGATTTQVAAAIFTSVEYRQDLVQSYYLRFLRRAADKGGLAAFVNALGQGARDQDVIAAIIGSPEYYGLL